MATVRPDWAPRWGVWPLVICRFCGGRTPFPVGYLRRGIPRDEAHPICLTRSQRGDPTPLNDSGDPEHLIVDGIDLGAVSRRARTDDI
jgi:hypothetical protein